jgi:hypothetical protein
MMARAMEKSILGVSGGIVRTLMRMKAITLQMGGGEVGFTVGLLQG